MKKTIELEKIYSVTEVSQLLQCTRQNCLYHITHGNLKAIRIGKDYGVFGRSIKDMYLRHVTELPFNFI